jgi:hypothetical protein
VVGSLGQRAIHPALAHYRFGIDQDIASETRYNCQGRFAMSLVEEYLAWRRKPAVGCVFARLIALQPQNHDQAIEVEASAASPDHVAHAVAVRIDRLVTDPAVSAAVILLPGMDSLEKLTRTALALGQKPEWSVTTTTLQNPPAGPMVAVHISRHIPFQSGTCLSEALVLGPFDEFPATRRAPITALEIYVGVPRASDPKTGAPTTKANLAHMMLHLPTRKAFESMWEKSIQGRLRSLGGHEDSRAKAKVAFVVPADLAKAIGCAP